MNPRACACVRAPRVLVLLTRSRKFWAPGRRVQDGSTWLTSGLGSVIVLDGEPGDPTVELRHLKQPA